MSEETVCMLFTFEQTSPAVWVWRWWVFPLRWLLLGFCVLPVNSHLITCNYLWKELWVCLKPVLRALTHGTEEKPDKIFASLVKSPENYGSEVALHAVTVGVWCGMSATDVTGSIFLPEIMNANQYVSHFDITFKQLSDCERMYAFFQEDSAVTHCKQF